MVTSERSNPEPVVRLQREANQLLDRWHQAAASADEATYFSLMSEDAVFIGTDATERWSLSAFRAYAHPHFARGKAWSFRATKRHVVVQPSALVAWFDEELETERLGPARGSGVLVRTPASGWRIAHYVLSIPIPNDKFAAVKATIAGGLP